LLTPVDAAGSVFRFDLRDLGWDRRPFHVFREKEKAEAASLNLYDLLLLEYPLAERSDDVAKQLRKEYLEPAELVRPIPPCARLAGGAGDASRSTASCVARTPRYRRRRSWSLCATWPSPERPRRAPRCCHSTPSSRTSDPGRSS
jgi:hypothetical protein